MRIIHRDIAGGFIFSKDGKFLLGKNRKGGVYEGSFVVPGGGVDEGETKEGALHREMLEETGIDINKATVKQLFQSSGEHEKTLRDTGERVFVKMNFYNYRIDLNQNADEVVLKTEDDWYLPQWFAIDELKDVDLSEPTRNTLIATGIIKE
jgi:8-oxo-dGTP pyrophosphatase MutT (NUDIX family)